MRLYNTLTRKVEEFEPQDPENVKIYTCGPTVYSYQHIGNYAAYVYWDTLIRVLGLNGWKVNRVLNITDVGHLASDADEGEDKLEKGAAREGKTVWDIAEFYTDDFFRNFRALGLVEPNKITKATDYIEAQISLVDKLTEKGYTYETSDGVYYDSSKFPTYADFARLDLERLKAGARVEYNAEKRNPSDFALWKFIKPGEQHAMRWDYLGRPGYPGWHLECSAIIHSELGEPIDIHTGGIDHIMIHHSNEIAQSEAAFGVQMSRFWLHNNHLTINGEKISKSLGNVYDFRDLAKQGFSHLDFRMWVLLGHYQAERDFNFELMGMARNKLLDYKSWVVLRFQGREMDDFETTREEIRDSLGDNLNTSGAITALDRAVGTEKVPSEKFINFLDEALGLGLGEVSDISDELKKKIAEREGARAAKDYVRADELRLEIEKEGIGVLDSVGGPIWQYV